jgi:hypothetical protein
MFLFKVLFQYILMLVMYAHVLVQKDYCDMVYFVHSYQCRCLEKVAHNNVIVVMIRWHIVFFTTIFFGHLSK